MIAIGMELSANAGKHRCVIAGKNNNRIPFGMSSLKRGNRISGLRVDKAGGLAVERELFRVIALVSLGHLRRGPTFRGKIRIMGRIQK